MYDRWLSEKVRREQVVRSAPLGQLPTFVFDVEFRTLTPVKTGVDQLRQLTFAGIVLRPRTIALVNTLERAVEQHSQMIDALNKRSEEFLAKQLARADLAAVVFGLKVGTRVDDRYPTTLSALHMGTDDCIFFSKLLGDDLIQCGKLVAPRLPKRLRGEYGQFDFFQG